MKLKGVNSILIGPNDLSGSIGLLSQTNHSEVIKLYNRIADICNKNNMIFGAPVSSDTVNIQKWITRGASWFAIGGDISYLISVGKSDYEKINEIFNDMKK